MLFFAATRRTVPGERRETTDEKEGSDSHWDSKSCLPSFRSFARRQLLRAKQVRGDGDARAGSGFARCAVAAASFRSRRLINHSRLYFFAVACSLPVAPQIRCLPDRQPGRQASCLVCRSLLARRRTKRIIFAVVLPRCSAFHGLPEDAVTGHNLQFCLFSQGPQTTMGRVCFIFHQKSATDCPQIWGKLRI